MREKEGENNNHLSLTLLSPISASFCPPADERERGGTEGGVICRCVRRALKCLKLICCFKSYNSKPDIAIGDWKGRPSTDPPCMTFELGQFPEKEREKKSE